MERRQERMKAIATLVAVWGLMYAFCAFAEPPLPGVVVEPGFPSVIMTEGGAPVRVVRQRSSQDIVPQRPSSQPVLLEKSPDEQRVFPADSPPAEIRNPTLIEAKVGRWTPRHKAILVYDARPFLDTVSAAALLDRMVRDKLTRILVHLGVEEMGDLKTLEGIERWIEFLRTAKDADIVLDFWVDVSEIVLRDDGLELFFGVAPLPFGTLLLNFDDGGGTPLVAQFATVRLPELLRSVQEELRRPVGFVIPMGWMESQNAFSIAEVLQRMKAAEVVLSHYSTDAEAVAQCFSQICQTYPLLSFSLLQSVESHRPRTESYFTAGIPIFSRRMGKLCFDTSAGNALDLVIQSWEDYLTMER